MLGTSLRVLELTLGGLELTLRVLELLLRVLEPTVRMPGLSARGRTLMLTACPPERCRPRQRACEASLLLRASAAARGPG